MLYEVITDATSDKVSMMTIHSAKGLEFKNVIITGAEENLFPNALTAMSVNVITSYSIHYTKLYDYLVGTGTAGVTKGRR